MEGINQTMVLSVERVQQLKQFQIKFGIKFNDLELLNRAFCHKSYIHENKQAKMKDNERLGFFGDAVLKLAISEYLYKKYPDEPEGYLTKARAMIVSDATLSKIALELDLPEYLLLSKNEKQQGGGSRKSISANVLEAFFGAYYLDRGLDLAKEIIYKFLEHEIIFAVQNCGERDYKSMLQEKTQALGWPLPDYKVVKETGPEHEKIFFMQVTVGAGFKKFKEKAEGPTKKEAEQAAARKILDRTVFKIN